MEESIRLAAVRSTILRSELGDIEDVPISLKRDGDSRDAINTLFKEIEKFSLRNGLKNARVVITLPRNLLIWRYFRVPPVPMQELKNLVGFEIDKHLPVNSEEIYFHYIPVGQDAQGWNMLVAGTKKDLVRGIEEALKMSGTKPDAIIPDLWGLVYLLKNRGQETEGSSVLVHLENDEAEIALFSDDMPVLFRRFPLRGENEASAGGLSPQRRTHLIIDAVDEVIREHPAGEDLANGYIFTEGAGSEILPDELPASLISNWQVIRKTDVPIYRGGESAAGRILPLAGLVSGSGNPRYCPVNLLPSVKGTATRKISYNVPVTLFVLLLVSAGFLFGSMYYSKSKRLDMLDEQIANLKGSVEKVKALSRDIKNNQTRVEALEDTLTSRIMMVDFLDELTKAIPKTAYLNQISMKKNTVELSGYADSASGLISRLEASPMFKNVSFAAPITSQGQRKERFKIKLDLE